MVVRFDSRWLARNSAGRRYNILHRNTFAVVAREGEVHLENVSSRTKNMIVVSRGFRGRTLE